MVPPAPTALSTMTGCPSGLRSASARSRAILSEGPPAANGTTRVTGLAGKSAWAAASSGASARTAARIRVAVIVCLLRIRASGGQSLHLAVQVRLAFEADAGQIGQR